MYTLNENGLKEIAQFVKQNGDSDMVDAWRDRRDNSCRLAWTTGAERLANNAELSEFVVIEMPSRWTRSGDPVSLVLSLETHFVNRSAKNDLF